MFIRQKKNKSGSKSVQIISKAYKKYKVIKTLGSSKDEKILKELVNKAKQEIENLQQQYQLYFLFSALFFEIFVSSLIY